MVERKRLGKGLGALIPEAVDDAAETNEIALDIIRPNPFQPRKNFSDEKIEELAKSIQEHGVIQAVVVTPDGTGNGYFLVTGERRCRAAKKIGWAKIPAVIKKVQEKTMLEIALIENLQREDLNPVEEASAYRRLMQEHGYTQEELAKRLGRSRPSIANSIRLLGLPDDILELLKKNELNPGQARPLLSLADKAIQCEAAKQIKEKGLSAREAEHLASNINRGTKKRRNEDNNGKRLDRNQDPMQAELQLQIQRKLGTKVRIKQGKEGGTIEIFYYGDEDLERLVSKLLPGGIQ